MSYDDLSDFTNNTLLAELALGTTMHDNHVWTYYLYTLNNQSQ